MAEGPAEPLIMVGATGFEPATCCTQNSRATRLRYAPLSDAFATQDDHPQREARAVAPVLQAGTLDLAHHQALRSFGEAYEHLLTGLQILHAAATQGLDVDEDIA